MQNKYKLPALLAAALLAVGFSVNVQASGTGSLLTVTEEAQVAPIPDESGFYLLKSDGFYCLNGDGMVHNAPCVHFFDGLVIDGTVFDGYYYHDESGKFRADSPHIVQIANLEAMIPDDNGEYSQTAVFDGIYMVNNLGKLNAAPQVRYLTGLVLGNLAFEGFYFFDENGRLVMEPGVHSVSMVCNGKSFDGYYYFGGENGALVGERMVTPDGFSVDEEGRLENLDDLGMDNLEGALKSLLEGFEGQWGVYVKDLNEDEELLINNQQLYSASLIKAFVLAASYQNYETVMENEAIRLNLAVEDPVTEQKLGDLFWNMITISDNESFNELVRLQTDALDFKKGAEAINEYLAEQGYQDTTVQHTLLPSTSASEGLGGRNMTSVKDCGRLLEQIYRGECVSEEASAAMLNLLLNQKVTWKIPEGLDSSIVVANKTGETDTSQHDMAIVYGEKTDYILCVMSEGCEENAAIDHVRSVSRMVYNYLNLFEDAK
jgi:beta-lactamase class A